MKNPDSPQRVNSNNADVIQPTTPDVVNSDDVDVTRPIPPDVVQIRLDYINSIISPKPNQARDLGKARTLRQPTPPFKCLHEELHHTIAEARQNIKTAVDNGDVHSRYYLPLGHHTEHLTIAQKEYRDYISNRIVGLFVDSPTRTDNMPVNWDPLGTIIRSPFKKRPYICIFNGPRCTCSVDNDKHDRVSQGSTPDRHDY